MYINYDKRMEVMQADYELHKVTANCLGITLDEYFDFVAFTGINTVEYTLDEITQMYVEFCGEYDIPCLQIDNPMALYGAI